MRIIFAGTPEFATKHLSVLINSKQNIVGVYTQPDRPAGRGKKLTPSPTKQLAIESNIPVFQPVSLKKIEAQEELKALEPDLMIVVAYGLLLPKAVLDIPKYGCINVHGSILPRWRGAAPIQRAIEAGDTTSGVTIMQMDVGLDTGDMLIKSECEILDKDTTLDLHDRLCEIGPPALLKTIELIEEGKLAPEKQDDSLSNYAKKIEKHEAEIDWTESVEVITRKIRAFNPFPICFTSIANQRLKIHFAVPMGDSDSSLQKLAGLPGQILSADKTGVCVQTGDGQILLTQLQLPGKKMMDSAAFLNGFESLIKDGNGYIRLGNN